MCGIVGVYRLKEKKETDLSPALSALSKRGPDSHGQYHDNHLSIGQSRLSIIDTSNAAMQPMSDASGRYTISFNGEIYNYQSLKAPLEKLGVHFKSDSDTEVLLYLYIHDRESFLEKLTGFFAFAIYDKLLDTVFVARDRIGIKPLLYYQDSDFICFASEMKALLKLPIKKQLNKSALLQYLQMNYVAGPISILKDVKKLLPGHSMLISSAGISEMKPYYSIPYSDQSVHVSMTYEEAKTELHRLVHESVQLRLIADVPLGAFLSGGIDSSIIVSTAVQYKKDLNTFSIGFKDEPYFDETKYANLVAKKFKTNHTVFSVTNEDMYEQLFNILDYIDEPFADSSAIAVFILSKLTREKVTVALSGDGGDELFAGYNKHKAEWRARNGGIANHLIKMGAPLWSLLPKSRNSKIGNIFRQLERFSEGLQKSDAERYWRWCSFIDDEEAMRFVKKVSMEDMNEYTSHKQYFTSIIKKNGRFDDTLLADMNLLLPNDMLTKVDLMSMANSLEVRVPLLDHHIVNFAFSLPTAFKINANDNKRLLKDAFRDELPEELFTRPKHGFEVPLLNWFRTGLRSLIFDDLLEDTFIETQNIFELEKIKMLKKQLLSNNPGDVVAQIWGLIVFQYWWKKYMQD